MLKVLSLLLSVLQGPGSASGFSYFAFFKTLKAEIYQKLTIGQQRRRPKNLQCRVEQVRYFLKGSLLSFSALLASSVLKE